MIYKNGIKVNRIELIVDDTSLICHIHLSDNQVFSGKPEQLDPSVMNNQTKLETMSILTTARTLRLLREEIEK